MAYFLVTAMSTIPLIFFAILQATTVTHCDWVPPVAAHAPVEAVDFIVPHPTIDPEMDQAMERARRTLPRFFDLADSGVTGVFLLKMRLTDGLNTEHVWIEPISYQSGVFCGPIVNWPRIPGYQFGDHVLLRTSEVEDWLVDTGAELYGGYTIRVLLKSMTAEEAAAYATGFRD